MFKGLLIQWITELNDKIIAVGQNGYLSVGIGAFNPVLYGYIKAIMTSVVMPIAYVILALFFMLELYNANLKMVGTNGGPSYSMRVVFSVVIRIFLCKFAVDSALVLMEGIYAVSLTITTGISGILSGGAVAGGLDLVAITQQINDLDLGGQLGMFVELLIVKFAVFIILGLVQVICIARFIELYIYVAVSPIPLATFPSEELSSIGKNFLKSFAAVCIQGALIYLVVSFFPILFNANVLQDTSVMGMLLYSVILAIGVLSSGRWAKSICNAM